MSFNFTMFPNFYCDELLEKGEISGNEMIILIYILRHTLGYHKDSFKISLSELCKKLSLSNKTVIKSLKTLEDKKIITIVKAQDSINEYFINKELFVDKDKTQNLNSSGKIYTPLVENLHTPPKISQEKKLSHPYYIKKNSLSESKESASKEAKFSFDSKVEEYSPEILKLYEKFK